jgi:hypothetical protein
MTQFRILYKAEFRDLVYRKQKILTAKVVKSMRLRWSGHVGRTEGKGMRTEYRYGKPHGNRSHERPRIRWENNIKIDIWGL